MTIIEALEYARRFYDVDNMWLKLDRGVLDPCSAVEAMVSAGVDRSVAVYIAEEASGLVLTEEIK